MSETPLITVHLLSSVFGNELEYSVKVVEGQRLRVSHLLMFAYVCEDAGA